MVSAGAWAAVMLLNGSLPEKHQGVAFWLRQGPQKDLREGTLPPAIWRWGGDRIGLDTAPGHVLFRPC
jgi:hypothetical protein